MRAAPWTLALAPILVAAGCMSPAPGQGGGPSPEPWPSVLQPTLYPGPPLPGTPGYAEPVPLPALVVGEAPASAAEKLRAAMGKALGAHPLPDAAALAQPGTWRQAYDLAQDGPPNNAVLVPIVAANLAAEMTYLGIYLLRQAPDFPSATEPHLSWVDGPEGWPAALAAMGQVGHTDEAANLDAVATQAWAAGRRVLLAAHTSPGTAPYPRPHPVAMDLAASALVFAWVDHDFWAVNRFHGAAITRFVSAFSVGKAIPKLGARTLPDARRP